MKLNVIKQSLMSNLTLKICSFIVGCLFWFLLSGSHIISITIDVPVYFYGNLKNKHVYAPDHVSIDLQCKRSKSYFLDLHKLAAHINVDMLSTGTNKLLIGREHIFLPQDVTLLHCKPAFIPIALS
jgi:hypothetical protein